MGGEHTTIINARLPTSTRCQSTVAITPFPRTAWNSYRTTCVGSYHINRELKRLSSYHRDSRLSMTKVIWRAKGYQMIVPSGMTAFLGMTTIPSLMA